ncbi:F-box domain containing protein [Tanacetum coccineum]
MSDNIPLEIQMEIMQRLPVNSLLQFRTVSNTWKSFIDGRNFLVSYGVRLTQPSRFLVSYELGGLVLLTLLAGNTSVVIHKNF